MSEREVEIPWLLEQEIAFPALDVGSHESSYLRVFSDRLTPLDGIDIRPQTRGGLADFYLGDIRTWVAPHPYATVIALSTLEHIGLACEGYGTEADDEAEGDRRAVEGCMRALKPGGTLLLTVPFGPKAENRGWYRVYDQAALEDLVDGWEFSAEYHLNPEWAVGGVALVTVYC